MERIVFNDRLDAALCALFMLVVVSVLVYSVKAMLAARRTEADGARDAVRAVAGRGGQCLNGRCASTDTARGSTEPARGWTDTARVGRWAQRARDAAWRRACG
jgi:hypothetical protein